MMGVLDYRFGPFELLVRRQLLVHADAPVRVGSRALAILTVLLDGAGDVVSKERLMAAAWPSTFVDESNLKVNIAQLRRALASNDPAREYIACVPGRGYRFVAPIYRTGLEAKGLPPRIPLVGREDDSAAVQECLRKGAVVTIVGTGGVGKTALATAVAHAVAADYPDGIFFIDLAKISAADFIPAGLAFELGLRTIGEDPLAEVIGALEEQRRLLLIDNCEHLVPSVSGMIERLSTNLEGVRILATSREPLRIRAEHVYRLNPLKSDPRISPTASEALVYPAVELFVRRAFERAGYKPSDADAPDLAEICRRLDGIPLAIELAATRIGELTPAQLLKMLDDRFKILARGPCTAPQRQQTLLAALDWSYNLLSESEATFLRSLSVFAGAFNIESAIAVAPNNALPETAIAILSALAAKSFLIVDWQEGAVTYRLLETMRAYLSDQLRLNGEDNDAKYRHATFMCTLLERAGKPSAIVGAQDWHAKFDRCLEDTRSAVAWALSSDEHVFLGIRLVAAALPLWSELSLLGECRETSERALARLDAVPAPDQQVRARLLLGLAIASAYASDDADAHRCAWIDALQAAQAIDDADVLAQALAGLARCEMLTGRHTDALRRVRELCSLANRLENGWAKDEGEVLLAHCEIYKAQFQKALSRLERLAERQARNQLLFRRGMQQVAPHLQLGVVFAATLWLIGSPARAASVADAAVRDAQQIGHQQSLCEILAKGAALVALWNGHIERATRYASEFARLVRFYRLAIWKPVSLCLDTVVACAAGKQVGVEKLVAASDAMLGLPPSLIRPIYLVMVAEELATRGQLVEARRSINAARARVRASQGEHWTIPELLRVEASLAVSSGDVRAAEGLLLQSLAFANKAGAKGWSLRTAVNLAQLRRDVGREREAVAILGPALAQVVDGSGTKDFEEATGLLLQLTHRRTGKRRFA
jgi:predicted ATPase/DNA-binding winged helix-turn-helix (wHTH) protein